LFVGVDFIKSLRLPGVTFATADSDVVSDQGVVTLRNFAESALSMQREGPMTFGLALFDAIAAHRHHNRNVDKVPA
jgi:hypothetical protein